MTRYVSQEAYEAALNPTELLGQAETVYQYNPTEPLQPSPQFNPFSGGQGIMGSESIRRYLTPILQQVRQAYDENKINPYVQEVQQLTNQTFPDLNLNGGGLRGGLGSIFGGGMGGSAGGNQLGGGLLNIPQSSIVGGSQVSNTIQSSSNQNPSPFGTASFFR
jgi:hypothetical protein